MYFQSDKEKLFNAINSIDLNYLNSLIGSDEFWSIIPDLVECGYSKEFYDNWDSLGLKATLLKYGEGLSQFELDLLASIGQFIEEVGY